MDRWGCERLESTGAELVLKRTNFECTRLKLCTRNTLTRSTGDCATARDCQWNRCSLATSAQSVRRRLRSLRRLPRRTLVALD